MPDKTGFKRICVFFLLVPLISALFFPGCGNWKNSDEPDGQVKFLIGMSQANFLEPWRVAMSREIKEEAEKYKDIRIIFTDAAQDSRKQINDVKKLMDQGIDLLMISPNDAESLTPIISKVYETIPVIVLDRDVKGSNYTLFIGPNNRDIGRQAGQFVVELLGEKGGNVVEIVGLSGSPPVRDRSEGFKEAVSKYPNIKIVDVLEADWLKDKAEDRLKERITRYPRVDVVFAHNDAMAQGAYIAASKLRIKNIKFIGIDGLQGSEGGIQLVKNGILEGTFTCPTGGKEAVNYAARILNNEKGIPKRVTIESKKISK